MQQVERRDVSKKGLSPVKGLLIVAALALAGGAFLLLSNNDPEPTTPNTNAPTTLTHTEATTVFENLHQKLDGLYRGTSDLADVFVPDSPAEARLESDLTNLKDANVAFEPAYETKSVHVDRVTLQRVVVTQVVVSDGRLIDSDGNDVTKDREPELQTIEWTLKNLNGQWLIYDSIITRTQAYEGSR